MGIAKTRSDLFGCLVLGAKTPSAKHFAPIAAIDKSEISQTFQFLHLQFRQNLIELKVYPEIGAGPPMDARADFSPSGFRG